MQVATAAALSLLLVAPTMTHEPTRKDTSGPTSAKSEETARQAHSILLRRAKAIGEPFLSLSSRAALEAALVEALSDEALLARLDQFDQTFHANINKLSSRPTDREAMARLIGATNAERILSSTPLDEAHKKVFEQLEAEVFIGIRRPTIPLLWVPPGEAAGLPDKVRQRVLDGWKSKVAGATLIYAVLGDKVIQGWLADTLYETIAQGKRSTLVLLASMGVAVPEPFAPVAERIDLQATFRQERRLQGRRAPRFAGPIEAPQRETFPQADLDAEAWEEPDFEALEATLRASLQQQGQNPDEVLRRATENVRRAYENQDDPTDEDIRRAAGWVLGQA